jgi:hypothetical protein
MNKPRDGNIPNFHPPIREQDLPDTRHPLSHKVDSGLAEPRRDTARNRHLARQQGWSEADWERWIEFGLVPGQKAPEADAPAQKPSTQIITDEIDERVGRRMKEDD